MFPCWTLTPACSARKGVVKPQVGLSTICGGGLACELGPGVQPGSTPGGGAAAAPSHAQRPVRRSWDDQVQHKSEGCLAGPAHPI